MDRCRFIPVFLILFSCTSQADIELSDFTLQLKSGASVQQYEAFVKVSGENRVIVNEVNNDTSQTNSLQLGYEFMPNWVLELGYTDGGSVKRVFERRVSNSFEFEGQLIVLPEEYDYVYRYQADIRRTEWNLGIKSDTEVNDNIDVFGRLA